MTENKSQIDELEAIVRKRTPQYTSLSQPSYDEKLMVAHYMLAGLYNGIDRKKAHSHFIQAANEFSSMCGVLNNWHENAYVSREGWRAFTESAAKTRRDIVSCADSLYKLGKEIGMDYEKLVNLYVQDKLRTPIFRGMEAEYDGRKRLEF